MTSDHDSGEFVSLREFERHVKLGDERHGGLVLAIEDIKTKQAETREALKDIKTLIILLICATAPQLISFVSGLMTKTGAAH